MIQYFEVDTGGARPREVGFPGIVPVIGGVRCRSAASDRTSASTPPRCSPGSWNDATTRSEHRMRERPFDRPRRGTARRDPARRAAAHRRSGCPPTARWRSSVSCSRSASRSSRSARWRGRTWFRRWPTPSTWSPRSNADELRHGAGSGSRRRGTSRRPWPRAHSTSSTASRPPTPTTRPTSAATTEESLEAMPAAVGIGRAVGGPIQLCIATSFTCPFEGVPRSGCSPSRRTPARRAPRTSCSATRSARRFLPRSRPGPRVREETPAAPHRLPRARHVGTRRGQHAGRDHRGRFGGRRVARRARRLPVRTRRERQHLDGGHGVRDPTRPGSRRHAGVDGGDHRQAARRTRRAEPVEDRPGRAVQVVGVRVGHRLVADDPPSWSPTPSPNRGWGRCALRAGCMCPKSQPTPDELRDACAPATSTWWSRNCRPLRRRPARQRPSWPESRTMRSATTTSTSPPRPRTASRSATHRVCSPTRRPIWRCCSSSPPHGARSKQTSSPAPDSSPDGNPNCFSVRMFRVRRWASPASGE